MNAKKNDEYRYIVEHIAIGNSVKVTAFDPHTLTEVSVIGSTKASHKELSTLAVRKLEYMIQKLGKS